MIKQPAFFERIRRRAAERWDQLERDPDLAGPWHQLFKQVQSPRHVLSELLQNADDAGARKASVRIDNGVFTFEHDGEDFTEEHFSSLCRFGYSNKRALHTIGFRGIGFKSTFSLGDRVEVVTPTLAVYFDRRRFTEPVWSGRATGADRTTCVQVAITDQHRRGEVQRNLDEWAVSPASLLFFKHIRHIRIGDKDVRWHPLGPGPTPHSERMVLDGADGQEVLIVKSAPEPFPVDALTEIRQERMLTGAEDTEFPPCTVEIVVGTKGRLYVVLPTGVETTLPFACNGPFIQDPARLKIKDPETSPTNRWLLTRAGDLAATTMLAWLKPESSSARVRARAYGLFPDVDREDSSLAGVCGATVEQAFAERIRSEAYLLTENDGLVPANRSVVLPEPIASVWPPHQAAALFDEHGRAPLSQEVAAADRKKLVNWGVVGHVEKPAILQTLLGRHLPKPTSWEQLLRLWAYIAPETTGYWPKASPTAIKIVPVHGKDALYAASEVVRLGEKKLLEWEADWQFLSKHLLVVNQGWLRFLSAQEAQGPDRSDGSSREEVNVAHEVLAKAHLDEAANVSDVIDHVAEAFFANKDLSLADCIRIAHIAAHLGVTRGNHLNFVTRDRHIRQADVPVLYDEDGTLEALLPEEWRATCLLHESYVSSFDSCSRDEWLKWISSGRSGLHSFPPLVQTHSRIWGRAKVEKELRDRGQTDDLTYHYRSEHFVVEDWDFDPALWSHWEHLTRADEKLWVSLAERILAQPENYWSGALNVSLVQIAQNGNQRTIPTDPLTPTWIIRLRAKECLRDTHGFRHKPVDLLRRTPQTESLMDMEPFVHASVDREATRTLLDSLGVRSQALGPDRLLESLRALSKAKNPPIAEVEKWYRRLDQMVDVCSTSDLQEIKAAFRDERLVYTEKGDWASTPSVFLASDEQDVPGAPIVRASVRHLALWRKLDVAERPTAELAISWLKSLASGQRVPPADAARVRAVLMRHPVRIWEECGHWLNLAGEWVAVETLAYALSMQSLVAWKHLHDWVKQKSADLQGVSAEVTGAAPFSHLQPLAACVSDRLHRDPTLRGDPETKPWLTTFGAELSRIQVDDESETARLRALAVDLEATLWQRAPGLEIIPYIDGTPAGTPRKTDVLWLDRVLYVNELPIPKLAKRVPEEVAKPFSLSDVRAALDYSFERSPADVRAYLEENFTLAPRDAKLTTDESAQDASEERVAGTEPAREPGRAPEAAGGGAAKDPEAAGVPPAPGPEHLPQQREEEPEASIDEGEPGKARRPRQPSKPSIIERFAVANGFQRDGEDRFFRSDGSWIAKANGARFPWERRSLSGELVRYFLPKDHCLDHEPLEVDADVWALLDGKPGLYALILADDQGEPVELPGESLRKLRDQERLRIFPAAYRLVLEGEQDA